MKITIPIGTSDGEGDNPFPVVHGGHYSTHNLWVLKVYPKKYDSSTNPWARLKFIGFRITRNHK
jgi:hypothetical protein